MGDGIKDVKAGWYNAFRPWTLHGAIIPVLLGGAFAYVNGSMEWLLFAMAIVGGVLFQSAANLLNTYGDFETGLDTVDNHTRSPELVTGKLKPKEVLFAGLACLGIIALMGLYMIWATGWGILVFGLVGIVGAGLYTVGLSYKYLGLGQISVFINFGFLMPMGTYYLMTGGFSWELMLASIPNAMMITAVLGGNELRDFESDMQAGVNTLSNRLGYDRAMKLYLALNSLPFAVVPALVIAQVLPWPALIVFVALHYWYKMYTNAGKAKENKRAGFLMVPYAFKQNWVFGLLLIAGYLIGMLYL